MPAAYDYDAFISFSSKDSEWARRLNDDMRARGIRTFFAPDLRVGTVWAPALDEALRRSQHVVIVWSAAVGTDFAHDFVHKEIAAFEAELSRLDANTAREANRRVIQLLLGRQAKSLEKYQAIADLEDGAAYAQGAGWIDTHGTEWRRVVTRICESVKAGAEATAITTAVLSMTAPDVRKLIDQGVDVGVGEPWDTMLARLRMDSDKLIDAYGSGRRDWRPFGRDEDIGSVLDRLRAALEERAAGEHFRLDYVDESFWSPRADDVRPEAAKLSKGLSLLVIDPLSLYNPTVRSRFDFLDGCFENPHAAIMLLAPFAPSDRTTRLRDLAKDMATKVYTQFYDPVIEMRNRSAHFSVMTGDEIDIRRMMLMILRGRDPGGEMAGGTSFLRVADARNR